MKFHKNLPEEFWDILEFLQKSMYNLRVNLRLDLWRINYSFIMQRSIINSPNRWKQVDLRDLEKFENIWIRVKENAELFLQIVRVYFYFYVNSDLIQIRADSFPAKMFRAAIG